MSENTPIPVYFSVRVRSGFNGGGGWSSHTRSIRLIGTAMILWPLDRRFFFNGDQASIQQIIHKLHRNLNIFLNPLISYEINQTVTVINLYKRPLPADIKQGSTPTFPPTGNSWIWQQTIYSCILNQT